MRLPGITRFLVPAVLLGAAAGGGLEGQSAASPGIDTASIPLFWRIHDTLKQDLEPADSLWDALWATPGYALLQARERRRADLTRALQLAYRPSLAAEARAARTASGWVAFVLPHVERIPASRARLETFVDSLLSADLLGSAIELAATLLPEGATTGVPRPTVSLAYFIDARGYPERLLLDPLYLMSITYPRELLAHEVHHYYRNRNARPHRPFGNDLLAWNLENVAHEGIAGLLDKRTVPGLSAAGLAERYPDPRNRAYFERYQVEYGRSNDWIALTDSTLSRIAVHPDSAAALGAWLHDELPDLGRIMGAFMAVTIEDILGRQALIDAVPDAFAFWRAYDRAARASGGRARPLSAASLKVIGKVEAAYAGEPGSGAWTFRR